MNLPLSRLRGLRLLALCLPLLLVAGTVVAHAATLGLARGSLGVFSAADSCAPAGVTTTAPAGTTSTVVTLGSVPSACNGRAVQLVVYRSDGAALSTAVAGTTLVVTSGTATVAVPTYTVGDVAGTALTLDGWGTAATWSPGSPSSVGQWPVSPGNAATVISATGVMMTNNPVQVCVDITVTTPSTTPVVWRVTLDMTKPPFNGQTNVSSYSRQGADGWRYAIDQASAGTLQVSGTAAGGRRTIVAGQQYVVTICHYGLPNPPVTPSAYTVTTSAPVYDAASARACVTTTITGNGTSDFYVGWSATLDLRPAVALLATKGRTPTGWAWGSTDWSVQRAQQGSAAVFGLTSRTSATIRGTGTFVHVGCVTG